jgi:cell division septal protein FtsQ
MNLWQKRLIILVILVAAAGYGVAHLFAITNIEVQGPGGAGEVSGDVKRIIGSSWGMHNLLTFNDAALMSKLQQADPAIRSVKVARRPWHTLVVTVTLKQPSLGWSTGNQLYLLDSDGTVIGLFPGGSKLPTVVDASNLPVKNGQQVVSDHFVAFVQELMPALAAAGYRVGTFSIKDTTLDLTVTTDKGYSLIFDTSRSAGDEVRDLKSVQVLLKQQNKTPGSYIDLRIAGKAYWK